MRDSEAITAPGIPFLRKYWDDIADNILYAYILHLVSHVVFLWIPQGYSRSVYALLKPDTILSTCHSQKVHFFIGNYGKLKIPLYKTIYGDGRFLALLTWF
jgi:hypothetical protein